MGLADVAGAIVRALQAVAIGLWPYNAHFQHGRHHLDALVGTSFEPGLAKGPIETAVVDAMIERRRPSSASVERAKSGIGVTGVRTSRRRAVVHWRCRSKGRIEGAVMPAPGPAHDRRTPMAARAPAGLAGARRRGRIFEPRQSQRSPV